MLLHFNDVKFVDALVLNRPLWVEFQNEQSTFAVDNQYMIGDIIFLHLSSLLRFLHLSELLLS